MSTHAGLCGAQSVTAKSPSPQNRAYQIHVRGEVEWSNLYIVLMSLTRWYQWVCANAEPCVHVSFTMLFRLTFRVARTQDSHVAIDDREVCTYLGNDLCQLVLCGL